MAADFFIGVSKGTNGLLYFHTVLNLTRLSQRHDLIEVTLQVNYTIPESR